MDEVLRILGCRGDGSMLVHARLRFTPTDIGYRGPGEANHLASSDNLVRHCDHHARGGDHRSLEDIHRKLRRRSPGLSYTAFRYAQKLGRQRLW